MRIPELAGRPAPKDYLRPGTAQHDVSAAHTVERADSPAVLIQACLAWRCEVAAEAGSLAPCARPRARAACGGIYPHHVGGRHGSPVRPDGSDPAPARWLAGWPRQEATRGPRQEPWSANATTAGLKSGRSAVRSCPWLPSEIRALSSDARKVSAQRNGARAMSVPLRPLTAGRESPQADGTDGAHQQRRSLV
jgi:hypothetical protein